MRDGARIQAAIDLVAAVERALRDGGPAADDILKAYFRERRYAGAGDRRAVAETLYRVLRRRGALVWRLAVEAPEPRMMVLLDQCLEGRSCDELSAAFAGDPHAPAAIEPGEAAALAAAVAADAAAMPGWARHNVPAWLEPSLRARFGARLDAELAALEGRAPVDLRVNLLRGGPADARATLPDAVPGRWASTCLRLGPGADVSRDPLYLSGRVEIQDEAAQVAVLACGVRPGMQVIDLCAGGGGKTLALAALMGNTGQIFAHDADARRLARLRPRVQRAGARNVQVLERAAAMPRAADLVVLDVPCGGSGTWRRNPELRWRLTPQRLEALTRLQDELLARGAGLVEPGGRLAYMTCSLLPEEDEARIEAFLARHPGFAPVPVAALWPAGEGPPPPSLSSRPDCLLLTPATHGTDGFFVAVLERAQ